MIKTIKRSAFDLSLEAYPFLVWILALLPLPFLAYWLYSHGNFDLSILTLAGLFFVTALIYAILSPVFAVLATVGSLIIATLFIVSASIINLFRK